MQFNIFALPVWVYICAAIGILLIAFGGYFLLKHFKKKHKNNKIEHIQNKSSKVWDVANLQGLGMRDSQQDAFHLSQFNEDTHNNSDLYLIVADGMGGISDGGYIAQATVENIAKALEQKDKAGDFNYICACIKQVSDNVRDNYHENGGSTLIVCSIKENQMHFACVGDSGLFLFRNGRLIELARRHEYLFDLFEHVLEGKISLQSALNDPQKGSLSSFIGYKSLAIDRTYIPLTLQKGDTLLLCSDGVTDTLNLKQIADLLKLDAQNCCKQMAEMIQAAKLGNQDNYTAIVAKYF